ncbi:MAG: cation:proton antiporter [bacterium]|nr:cation:proton antiporter [bacterium]
MEHGGYLPQLLIVVTVGVVAALLLARFKLPPVAGFLLAGAIVGPHGVGLISDVEGIQRIAEFGVVLLLFTLGVEFSGERLRRLGKIVLSGGLLQVALTVGAAIPIAMAFGQPISSALFYGFIFALSSTAIVLRLYQQSGELDAPHGRFVVGALLFQDIAVVLFVLLTPVLAGSGDGNQLIGFLVVLGKAALLIGFAFFASRYFLGPLLRLVDGAQSRELFVLTTLTICLGTAFLSSFAGLSLALGAFLAGVVMASSGYGHRALGEVLPLRDVLTSVFFITLGMLFDWHIMTTAPLLVLALLVAFVAGKGLIATIAAMLTGFPARVAWLAGVGLAQFGEFGFVLITAGLAVRLITPEETTSLLAAGILSMMVSPLLMRAAPRMRLAERILQPLERFTPRTHHPTEDKPVLRDHVVIAGYGPGGKLLSRVLLSHSIPYVLYDLNSDAVAAAQRAGENVRYGDMTHSDTLEHAQVDNARAVVVMFNDPHALPRTIEQLHRYAPNVPLMVRCRYIGESAELLNLGAGLVVVEEVETGFTMLRRVLHYLGHSEAEVRREMAAMRDEMELNTERSA